MQQDKSAIWFYVLVLVKLTDTANAGSFGILMCKPKSCTLRTCEHIYYSSQKLFCQLVKKASNKNCETLINDQVTCDIRQRSDEELQSFQHNGGCPCLILLTTNQSFTRLPEYIVPGTLQPEVDNKTGPQLLPVDVKQVICEPPAIDVHMEFEPGSVHQTCSLVDGVLRLNKPRIRRRREGLVQGARSYTELAPNGTGSQWFGIRVTFESWQQTMMTPILQTYLCRAGFADKKLFPEKHSMCSGFSLWKYDDFVGITSENHRSKHDIKQFGSIGMKESYDFAVVIRREQHELVLLDMVGKRVIIKCDPFKIEVASIFVVKLNDRFPVSVKFESLHTDDCC